MWEAPPRADRLDIHSNGESSHPSSACSNNRNNRGNVFRKS